MKKTGFTLIEILVSTTCLLLFMSLSGFLTNNFYENYSNSSTEKTIYTFFLKTKNKSISNLENSTHGIYFDNLNKKIFFFKGLVFNNSTVEETENMNFELDQNSDTEVTFTQLSGHVETTKIFIFKINQKIVTLNINSKGVLLW